MKKRILYHYGSSHFDTGSPRALVGIMDLLDRTRFQPLFLPARGGPLVSAVQARGVEVLRPGQVRSVSWRASRAARRQIAGWCDRLIEDQVDLLHLNELGWNSDIVLAAWLVDIPVVLHLHNPVSIRARNLNVNIADRILMPSQNHRHAISGFHRIADKHSVLYNTTTIPPTGDAEQVRKELRLNEDTKVILTVAQLSYRKGIDMVLDVAQCVWAMMPEVVFLIAGPDAVDESSYADQMREKAEQLRSDGNDVRFLGSRDDVNDLLSTAEVFFLPSRAEPFGIVFVEAMAAGVPVVASRVGGIPEVVAPHEGGVLVDDFSPEAFASALLAFLGDSPLRTRVSEAARMRSHRVFGRETLSVVLNRTYSDLLWSTAGRSGLTRLLRRPWSRGSRRADRNAKRRGTDVS
jgi:glycosyltransferase involved in cell wall biosynthesis